MPGLFVGQALPLATIRQAGMPALQMMQQAGMPVLQIERDQEQEHNYERKPDHW